MACLRTAWVRSTTARVERLYRTLAAVVERTQAVRKQALGLDTGGPKAP